MATLPNEYHKATFLILYTLTLISGSWNRTTVQLRDIVLRSPCQNKAEVCVKIDACPNIAREFFGKKSMEQKRRIIKNISCRIHHGELDVCCPRQYALLGSAPNSEEDLVKAHPNLALLNQGNCGKRRLYVEHDDNEEIKPTLGEFPWLAILMYEDKTTSRHIMKCGGSLITHRFVLTAAHCLVDSRGTILPLSKVRLGGSGSRNEQSTVDQLGIERKSIPMEYEVLKSLPHPEYDGLSHANDIGLVTLDSNVKFTDFILPICLPVPDSVAAKKLLSTSQTRLVLAGWSLTDLEKTASDHSFRKLKMDYLNPTECNRGLKIWRARIDTKQFCARGRQGNACAGDSGGPLMMESQSKDGSLVNYQVGIVSYSFGGGCNTNPITLYTKVQPYLYWVLKNIRNEFR